MLKIKKEKYSKEKMLIYLLKWDIYQLVSLFFAPNPQLDQASTEDEKLAMSPNRMW